MCVRTHPWQTFSQALTVLLPQPGDELLGWDHAHFLLLRGNGVEEVSQTCEKVFLLLLLCFVGQHVLPERPAEVEGLQHRVTVASVSKLRKGVQTRTLILFRNMWKVIHTLLLCKV